MIPFFYQFNVVLLARLFFHYRDHPISGKHALLKSAIEILALLAFSLNPWMLAGVAGLIGLNFLEYYFENRGQRPNLTKLFTFILYLLFLSTLFAPFAGWQFNPAIKAFFGSLADYQWLINRLDMINWDHFHLILMGLLVSMNETNIFIRYFFEVLELVPRKTIRKNQPPQLDEAEYNRGRVIGFLERLLIFFLVLTAQYAAIGFILTAKGITRFKELNERSFAEYFLIGTLLSATLAGAISLLIKGLL